MNKKEALKLQTKLQDISFDEFKNFYTNVGVTEREHALVLMEHRISDLFYLSSGIEQDELDVVWSKLGLENDPEYKHMQEEYHKKLAAISQKLNVTTSEQVAPKNCHFGAIIRHGERADNVRDENKNYLMNFRKKVDPQLSPRGIE